MWAVGLGVMKRFCRETCWNSCELSGKYIELLCSRYLDPFQNFQRVKIKYLSYFEIILVS